MLQSSRKSNSNYSTYRGTIDVPSESAFDLTLNDVQADGDRLQFSSASDDAPLDFRGTMTADRISGNLNHGGSVTPLTFSKANSPPAAVH
jgi:hypothetical protein